MKELMGENAIYFDPLVPREIAQALETLIRDPERQKVLSKVGKEMASRYSWMQCSESTFRFLSERD